MIGCQQKFSCQQKIWLVVNKSFPANQKMWLATTENLGPTKKYDWMPTKKFHAVSYQSHFRIYRLSTIDNNGMTSSDWDYELFGTSSDSELEPEPEPERKPSINKKRKNSTIVLKPILKKTKIYNIDNKIEKIDYVNLYRTRFLYLKYVDKVEKLFNY